MARAGWFDEGLVRAAWFDKTTSPAGWFDGAYLEVVATAPGVLGANAAATATATAAVTDRYTLAATPAALAEATPTAKVVVKLATTPAALATATPVLSVPAQAVQLKNATDAYAASLSVLLPLDGDAVSKTGETWSTYYGYPTFANVSSGPFGNRAYAVTASGPSGITTPHSAELVLQSGTATAPVGDFTIEFWVYHNGMTYDSDLIYKGDGTHHDFRVWAQRSDYSVNLQFGDDPLQSTYAPAIGTGALEYHTWIHVAFCVTAMNGYSQLKTFANGVLIRDLPLTANDIARSQTGTNLPLYVGYDPYVAATPTVSTLDCIVSDVRITRAARYQSSFTPPTAMAGYGAGWSASRATASLQSAPFVKLSAYTDPFADKVGAMFHFSGVAGGAPNVDQTGKTWTLSSPAPVLSSGNTYVGANLTDTYWDSHYNGYEGYASTPYDVSLDVSDGSSFTIEAWVYLNWNATTGSYIFSKDSETPYGDSYCLRLNDAGYPQFFALDATASQAEGLLSATKVNTTTWTHIAVTYEASTHTYRLFVNGYVTSSLVGQTFPLVDKGGSAWLGGVAGFPERSFGGFLDEVRFTKGVARYTGAFTLPATKFGNTIGARSSITAGLLTAAVTGKTLAADATCVAAVTTSLARLNPLAANAVAAALATPNLVCLISLENKTVVDPYVANVISLLHFDGTDGSTSIVDETGRAWTGASAHGALSTSTSKFGVSSLSGDGVAQASQVHSGPSTDFDLGAGDFTIEFWIKPNNFSLTSILFSIGSMTDYGLYIRIGSDSFVRIDAYGSDVGPMLTNTLVDTAMVAGVWAHIAVARQGTTFYTFKDGTLTNAYAGVPGTLRATTLVAALQAYSNTAGQFNGFLDEFRLTKGVARYTSSFTPQVAAYGLSYYGPPGAVSVAGASLLSYSFRNFEASPVATALTTAGLSTVVQMRAGATAVATATPAIVTNPLVANSVAASTVTAGLSQGTPLAIAVTSTSELGATLGLTVKLGAAPAVTALAPSDLQTAAAPVKLLQALPASVATATAGVANNARMAVTAAAVMTANAQMTQIQDVKLAGGDPLILNTPVLMHFDGTNGSTAFVDSRGGEITVNGSAMLTTTDKKFGTASFKPVYASGDSVSESSTSLFLGGGDFTIEFWYKQDVGFFSNNLAHTVMGFGSNGGYSGSGLQIDILPNTGEGIGVNVYAGAGSPVYSSSITGVGSPGNWMHVALCRQGTRIYFVSNGSSPLGDYVLTSNVFTGTIGSFHVGNIVEQFPYAVDELRITKGYARYPFGQNYLIPGVNPDWLGDGPLVAAAAPLLTATLLTSNAQYANATAQATLTGAITHGVPLVASATASASASLLGAVPNPLAAVAISSTSVTASLRVPASIQLAAAPTSVSIFAVGGPKTVLLAARALTWPLFRVISPWSDKMLFVSARDIARATAGLVRSADIQLGAAVTTTANASADLRKTTEIPAAHAVSTCTATAALRTDKLSSSASASMSTVGAGLIVSRCIAAAPLAASVSTAALSPGRTAACTSHVVSTAGAALSIVRCLAAGATVTPAASSAVTLGHTLAASGYVVTLAGPMLNPIRTMSAHAVVSPVLLSTALAGKRLTSGSGGVACAWARLSSRASGTVVRVAPLPTHVTVAAKISVVTAVPHGRVIVKV